MIPNKKNTNGCNPLSSNCVVWQGPDLDCIDVCQGDTISDIVAKIAEEICDTANTAARGRIADSEINGIVQKCITVSQGRSAENLQELLQFIIDKICETDDALSRTAAADPKGFATAYSMPLPEAAQFDQGSTRIKKQVL